jgi:hypothetical protein
MTLSTTGLTITNASNDTQLTLKSTDADSSSGPVLDLFRDSGSPADSDVIGQINFSADDDAGNQSTFFRIRAQAMDVSEGSEDAAVYLNSVVAGSMRERLTIKSNEIAINDDSLDFDFRVESNGNANALIVDAGHSTVGINTAAVSNRTLKIEGEGNLGAILSLNESTRGGLVEFSAGSGTELYIGSELGIMGSGNNNELLIHTGVSALKIDRSGNSTFANSITLSDGDLTLASGHGINFSATGDASGMTSELLDDYEEGTFTPTTSSSSYTVSESSGSYTKVGRLVNAHLRMTFSAVNSSSNSTVNCNNMPFVKASGIHNIGVGRETSTNGAIFVTQMTQATNVLNMNSMDGIGNGSQEAFTTSKAYVFHIAYET